MDQKCFTGFLPGAYFILTLCAPDLKRSVYRTHFPDFLNLLISLELYLLINDI